MEIYWYRAWHSWRLIHNIPPGGETLEAVNRLGRLTCALADSGRIPDAVLVFQTQKLLGPDAPCPFRPGTLTGSEAGTVCILQGHIPEAEKHFAFAEPHHLHGHLDIQLWKLQQAVELYEFKSPQDLEEEAFSLIMQYESIDYPNGVLEVLSLVASAERRFEFNSSPRMKRHFHEWGERTGQLIGLIQYPFEIPCMAVLLHRCTGSSRSFVVPYGQKLRIYPAEPPPQLPRRSISSAVVPTSHTRPVSMARERADSEKLCTEPMILSEHPYIQSPDSRISLKAEPLGQTVVDPRSATQTYAEPSEYEESVGSYRKQEMRDRNSSTNGRQNPGLTFSAIFETIRESQGGPVARHRLQRHLMEGNSTEKLVDVSKVLVKIAQCAWSSWRGDHTNLMKVMKSLAKETPAWLREEFDYSMLDAMVAMENINSNPIELWAQGKKLVDEANKAMEVPTGAVRCGPTPIQKLFCGHTFQAFAYSQIGNNRKLIYHADLALSVQHSVDPFIRQVLAPNLEFMREAAWVHTRYFVEDHILRDLTEYDIEQLHQSKLSLELKFNENNTLITLKTQLCCIIAMICVILRDDEGRRKWLAEAKELAERLQPKHGLRKETVQLHCVLVEAQALQQAAAETGLDAETISEMRNAVVNFEHQRQQRFRGMTKNFADVTDVQTTATLYFRLGCFEMRPNDQGTVQLDDIHLARVDFNAGLSALELIDAPVRYSSYQDCLFGIAYTYWIEGLTRKDCALLRTALLGFEDLEAVVDEVRSEQGPGTFSDFDNLRERRYFVGLREQRRVYQEAVEAALVGIQFSQETEEESDWFITKAWEWVQRQKARSVADLLGVSGNLSESHLLGEDLQQHRDLRLFFQKENDLVRRIQQAPIPEKALLRRELWLHRKRMAQEPLLAAEGLSFNNWASLSDVVGFNNVVFVDYFIRQHENKYGLFLIRTIPGQSEDHESRFEIKVCKINLTEKEIKAWSQKNLERAVLGHCDMADFAFEDVSALIEPLSKLTNKGDVIVLCPTGLLHRLPLHALPTGGNNGEILLERNPVVYTSSLYSTIQCMYHRNKPTSMNLAAVISAYDTSNGKNPPEEVLAVHQNLVALTASLRSQVPVSVETVPAFRSLAESHSLLHFHGHAVEMGTNGVHSMLQLASPTNTPQTLTMEQIMSWSLHHQNPLVINVACGSGTQDIQLGDEPLGLPTAWLIAGARAVIGTLWPIQSRDGRRFTERFYKEIEATREEGELNGIVNLAVAIQQVALKMRKEPGSGAPYHWAAFVLHGLWETELRG
jgi:hypothetical protein